MKSHWSSALVRLGACSDAVAWAKTQPTAAKAWSSCTRADWMLWIAGCLCRSEAERKAIVMAACACARTALVHVPAGELRPLRSIEAAEAWCRGEATLEQVRDGRAAAFAASTVSTVSTATATAATAVAYAASAVAYAASTAIAYAPSTVSTATAATAVAYTAATAVAYAADAAAYAAYAARAKSYAKMAPLVRRYIKRLGGDLI